MSSELVLWGYRQGMFPMADHPTQRIMWFSPDPRAILDLEAFHISGTLRQVIRQGRFHVTINRCFRSVIQACAQRTPTWISPELVEVYCKLHRLGYVHSVETWQDDELAGGLYGVTLGGAFFGESMFHHQTDASKVALVGLVQQLRRRQFTLLDTQYITTHLARFGVETISRDAYLRRLKHALSLSRQLIPDRGQTEIAIQA